jgi:hypothetical protein
MAEVKAPTVREGRFQQAFKSGEGRGAEREAADAYQRSRRRLMEGLIGGEQKFLAELSSGGQSFSVFVQGNLLPALTCCVMPF